MVHASFLSHLYTFHNYNKPRTAGSTPALSTARFSGRQPCDWRDLPVVQGGQRTSVRLTAYIIKGGQ